MNEQDVTQDTPIPNGVEDSTSESIEGTQPEVPEVKAEAGSKEYNFKQLREQVNRFQTENKTLQEQMKSLETVRKLDELIRLNPKKRQAFFNLLEQQEERKSDLPEIKFEDYDPDTAKLLKFLSDKAAEVEDLKQWKTQFEQATAQERQQATEKELSRNATTLDSEFNSQLIKDGYLDNDGNGDPKIIGNIRKSVIAELAQSGDPRGATREEFHEAYKQVLSELNALKNFTLKKTTTKSVPATGSKNGQATVSKAPVTAADRIAQMAELAQQSAPWNQQ